MVTSIWDPGGWRCYIADVVITSWARTGAEHPQGRSVIPTRDREAAAAAQDRPLKNRHYALVPDAVFGLLFGAFFIASGLWLLTHEHWALRIDREGYEQSPTRLRYLSFRLSRLVAKRLAPAALLILGVTVIFYGLLGRLD